MSVRPKSLIPGALACALVLSCSKSDLYVPQQILRPVVDNRIEVNGSFCAEGADDLVSLLKVMFIIDRSNSMRRTDPRNRRISAAQEVVERFLEDTTTFELRAGVEFAVISFFGDTTIHTRDERGIPGFSADGRDVYFGLTQIAQVSSNTGYDKALAAAFTTLDRDMAQLEDDARPRTRYEVVFISDGLPFPDNCRGDSNSPSAAVRAVERIAGLSTLYKVQLRFNTALAVSEGMFDAGTDVDPCTASDFYEATYNESTGEEVRALMQDMADVGLGTFKQFLNGDSISFLDFGFAESRRIYGLSNFVASDLSAQPAYDTILPDSDRDGLTDADEIEIGTSPLLHDSDGDGFSDLIEMRFRLSGFDPLDPTDASCDDLGMRDFDGDGLRDCEETFLGTQRRRFDTDNDGLPDLTEVIFGADPNSANASQDRQADSDADGGSNADELRWHTDPRIDDVAFRSRLAYDYYQVEQPITRGEACYDFSVRNIRMTSTLAIPASVDPAGLGQPAGLNRVMLYFAQTPYDDPLGEPLYRLACVEGRFVAERDLKVPADGIFDIPPRRPSDTHRASVVLRPNRDTCQVSVNQDCGFNTLWCRFELGGACRCYDPPVAATDPPDGINPRPCPVCSDGLDNDNDGITDYPFDPDCFDSMDGDEGSDIPCKNGEDDDGDGYVDWPEDPGCDSGYDTDEADPATPPACSNGADDDNDGATDYPSDPGCDFAGDPSEGELTGTSPPACDDGIDNDGDGLVDLADRGCFDPNDIDEDGPQTCFYCELFSDVRPNQCDIGAGYCKPRAGLVNTGGGSFTMCTDEADCRGAPCVAGVCSPCLTDQDCDTAPGAGDGLCQSGRGWCLRASYVPETCTTDADCTGGKRCGGGVCDVDPYYACRSDKDCLPGDMCSDERGFCLQRVFETRQCDDDQPCASGVCDEERRWCLPSVEVEECKDDSECPFGECIQPAEPGRFAYCDQQTFVFPENFRPEVDCIRGR